MMWSRVIVAYDGSARVQRARPIADLVATAAGCPVELVHVRTRDQPPNLELPEVQTREAATPAQGLIDAVHATTPPGLLCVATRGRRALVSLLLGSVSSQVIRHLGAPVLLVGPRAKPPAGMERLLVCLDGSTTAAAILPVARDCARELGMRVHLVHISYPLGDPPTGQTDVPTETRIIAAELGRTAADFEAVGIEVTWELVEDTDVASGIVRQAAHRMVDLIAVATNDRRGLARLLTGSVVLEAAKEATVPILTLTPERLP